LAAAAAPMILPLVARIMCGLPSKESRSDARESSLMAVAVAALTALAQVSAVPVIVDFMQNGLVTLRTNDWGQRYGALLILAEISGTRPVPELCPCIREAIPDVLAICATDADRRTQETALWALSRLISGFPTLFSSNENGVFDRIIDLVSGTCPDLQMKYVTILHALIAAGGSPIQSRWEGLFHRACALLTYEYSPQLEPLCPILASEAVSRLIAQADLPACLEDFRRLAEICMDRLSEGVRQAETSPAKFACASRLTRIAALMTQRIIDHVSEEFIARLIDLSLAVLTAPKACTFESVTTGVTAVCALLHRSFSEAQHRTLVTHLRAALETRDDDRVSSAAYLLSKALWLRPILPEEFFELFLGTFRMLVGDPPPKAHPILMLALGEMMESVEPGSDLALRMTAMKEGLLGMMGGMKTLRIFPATMQARYWANDYFEGVIVIHWGFLRWAYPKVNCESEARADAFQEERDLMIHIANLAVAVLALPVIIHRILRTFCRLARRCGELCSRRNNVLLNASPMHGVLKLCQDPSRPADLRDLGRVTAAFLRSR
jgi:hypothetical protein